MQFEDGTRRVSFRYAIIRNGVEYAPARAVVPASISMVSSGEVKTSLRGTFVLPEEADLLTDHIRPYMTIDGAEYPLGEYVVGTADEIYTGGAAHTEIEAYDLGSKVKNSYLSDGLFLQWGTKYLDAIQAQLIACGITNVIADPTSETLPTSREDWEIGTSRIKIINDLLAEINYRSLWFDNKGNARLSKYVAPAVENATKTYKADEYSVISAQSSRSLDIYGAYNDFVAVVSSPDYDTPLIARATNDDPSSALSVQRIGKRTAPVMRLNNISSQAALQEYVDNVRNQAMLTTETCTFTTALMPHEVWDIVILDHPQLQGVYEETEWTMPLEAGGEMSHKGKRVMYL